MNQSNKLINSKKKSKKSINPLNQQQGEIIQKPKKMSRNSIKLDQPLKSILKQPNLKEDAATKSLEREVKYWKTRFDDLMRKREKERENESKVSLKCKKEENDIQLFTMLEKQISDGIIPQQIQLNQKQDSTKENSLENQEDYFRTQINSETELNFNTPLSHNKKFKSMIDFNQKSQEIQSNIDELILERNQWKLKYEESIHPKNIKKLQDTILQDFLCKAQLGIQEAAEQFEEEKRAYLKEKEEECNELQQKVIDYARILSEKDSLLLQKEMRIAELDQDQRQLQEKDIQQRQLIAHYQEDQLSYSKQKLSWLEEESNLKGEEAKLKEQLQTFILSNKDLELLNQKNLDKISELQQKIDQFKQKSDDYQEKIQKLKNQQEEQEELNEQIEEYRNKVCLIEQENERLKSEQINLTNKLKKYENMIQSKGAEVQMLMSNLQQEIQNYATEVQLAQQSELKQETRVKELESQLLQEKQLNLILQDSIFNKSLVLQQQKQQTIQQSNNTEKVPFKDSINLKSGQFSSRQRDENQTPRKEIQQSNLLINELEQY